MSFFTAAGPALDELHESAIVEDIERELSRRGLNDPLAYEALAWLHYGRLSPLACLWIVTKAALAERDSALKLARDTVARHPGPPCLLG